MSIGITVLPVRLTRLALAGTCTSLALPAWTIRAPSTTMVPFSIVVPLPTMIRASS